MSHCGGEATTGIYCMDDGVCGYETPGKLTIEQMPV